MLTKIVNYENNIKFLKNWIKHLRLENLKQGSSYIFFLIEFKKKKLIKIIYLKFKLIFWRNIGYY